MQHPTSNPASPLMRRRARMALIFVLCGALLNALVAIVLSLRPLPLDGDAGLPTAADRAWWSSEAPPEHAARPVDRVAWRHLGYSSILLTDSRVPIAGSRIAVGWPLKSFASESWRSSGAWQSHGLLGTGRGAVPYRPVWPGLLLNSLFYALILLGGWRLAATLRARRRVRAGCCAACGYTLGTSTRCPECGAGARGSNPQP